VSHMPARRAISSAANSLSLRALEGCYRSQLTTMPGCLMGEFNGGCTAADGCRDSRAWRQRSSRLTNWRSAAGAPCPAAATPRYAAFVSTGSLSRIGARICAKTSG